MGVGIHFTALALFLSAMGLTTSSCSQAQKPKSKKISIQLHKAAQENDPMAIHAALDAGAELEAKDSEGRTALMVAAYSNHLEAARVLIDAGANVNAQDRILNSPFLYAGASGFSEIVKMCLKAGADYHVYNRYGGTALIPACEKGHLEVIKMLLSDKNYPVNHINKLGWTALLEAIILSDGGKKHQEVLRLLIAGGADVNIADGEGVSPLTHARRRNYKEMVSILEKAGAR